MSERRCVSCMKQISTETLDCPHCGQHQVMTDTASLGLRWNTILRGRYLVGKILGQGGFGITYVGYDLALDIKVAIKEYFPMGSATRNAAVSNKILWNTAYLSQQQWQKGCDSFLKEARGMARIDHLPEIVRVRDTFQENQTSYIVMDFVEGVNLKQKLMRQGVLKFSECLKLLTPLLKSLDQVHGYGLIHRDISPDNIMVQPNGHLCLLDFGAAKDVSLHPEASQQVTKRGFSPPEQYGGKGKLGPWTDVYAVCATMYYCVTGKMIPEAMDRLYGEEIKFNIPVLEPLSEPVTAVLKQGLELRPEDRIQSVDQLLTAFDNAVRHAVQKKPEEGDAGFKTLEAGKSVNEKHEGKKPADGSKSTEAKVEKQEKHAADKKTSLVEKPQKPEKKGKMVLTAVLAAVCIALVALIGRCSAGDAETTAGTTPVETTSVVKETTSTVAPETTPEESTGQTSAETEEPVPYHLPLMASISSDDQVLRTSIAVAVKGSGDYVFVYANDFVDSDQAAYYLWAAENDVYRTDKTSRVFSSLHLNQYVLYEGLDESCIIDINYPHQGQKAQLLYMTEETEKRLEEVSVRDMAYQDGIGVLLVDGVPEEKKYYPAALLDENGFCIGILANDEVAYCSWAKEASFYNDQEISAETEAVIKPETTKAPETTAAPDPETTATPEPETTAAPDPETTAAPETTAVPETTAAAPVAHGGANLLMVEASDVVRVEDKMPDTIFRSSYSRRDIRTVTILNTLADMPADAWDVSANMDGSVMAWVTRSDEAADKYNLFIAGEGGVTATSGANLFRGYNHCVSYNFNGCFDTSQVTSMWNMFASNKQLQSLDLSCFNTSQVTKMNNMFGNCENLRTLNIGHFDVSSVKGFHGMFQNCESLWELDLSSWKISSGASVSAMFSGAGISAYNAKLQHGDTSPTGIVQ